MSNGVDSNSDVIIENESFTLRLVDGGSRLITAGLGSFVRSSLILPRCRRDFFADAISGEMKKLLAPFWPLGRRLPRWFWQEKGRQLNSVISFLWESTGCRLDLELPTFKIKPPEKRLYIHCVPSGCGDFVIYISDQSPLGLQNSRLRLGTVNAEAALIQAMAGILRRSGITNVLVTSLRASGINARQGRSDGFSVLASDVGQDIQVRFDASSS